MREPTLSAEDIFDMSKELALAMICSKRVTKFLNIVEDICDALDECYDNPLNKFGLSLYEKGIIFGCVHSRVMEYIRNDNRVGLGCDTYSKAWVPHPHSKYCFRCPFLEESDTRPTGI